MSTHDTTLLRPLTLDDIKPGTLVTWMIGDKEVDWGKIVYGPVEKGQEFVVNWKEDGLIIHALSSATTKNLHLTPLAWVEDKPVYPGDVLYGKWEGLKKDGYGITGVNPDGLLMDTRGIVIVSDNADLTWTPPKTKTKTKHQAWVNLYPGGTACAHSSEAEANARAGSARIECRLIEWES